jgi:hypothetical protein
VPVTPVLIKELGKNTVVQNSYFYKRFVTSMFLIGAAILIFYQSLSGLFFLLVPISWQDLKLYLDAIMFLLPLNLMIVNSSAFFIDQAKEKENLISAILSFSSIATSFIIGIQYGISIAILFVTLGMYLNVVQVIFFLSKSKLEWFKMLILPTAYIIYLYYDF